MVFVASVCWSTHGQAAQAKFSPEAWRQPVDPKSPNWSRRALLTQFVEEYKLAGMERKKVIALLGEPATASELDPGGRYRSRIDTYCLSTKDEESFRIDYDDKDKVKGYSVEASPCKSCYLFIGPAPAADSFLKPDVLNKSFLQKYTDEQISNMKIQEVETIIGSPGKSWTVNAKGGGRIWMHFYYVWRLSADGSRIFLVNGRHRPVQDSKPGEDPGVESWAKVSMPDCKGSKTVRE
jgi:hypothetical protein